MDVIPDRRSRIAQGRASACILNTEARSMNRANVGRQTRRPALRNNPSLIFNPRYETAGVFSFSLRRSLKTPSIASATGTVKSLSVQ